MSFPSTFLSSLLQMERPKPVPFPRSFVVKKVSIILSVIALGIPFPESVTLISTFSSFTSASILIQDESLLETASILLEIRFIITCVSSPGKHFTRIGLGIGIMESIQ